MSLARLTYGVPSQGARAFGREMPAPPLAEGGTLSKGLDALSMFIPTEMLAPYVAFLAYSAKHGGPSSESLYWWFLLATPVASLLFQFARKLTDENAWPALGPAVWRSFAAAIAFAVWGLAPPGSAFQPEMGSLPGMIAIIVSPVLKAVDIIALKLMGVGGGTS